MTYPMKSPDLMINLIETLIFLGRNHPRSKGGSPRFAVVASAQKDMKWYEPTAVSLKKYPGILVQLDLLWKVTLSRNCWGEKASRPLDMFFFPAQLSYKLRSLRSIDWLGRKKYRKPQNGYGSEPWCPFVHPNMATSWMLIPRKSSWMFLTVTP